MQQLEANYSKKASDELVQLWFQNLREWPLERFEYAVKKIITESESQYFPVLSALIKAGESWRPKGSTVVANSELPKRETDEEFRARQRLAKQELERFKAERPDLFGDSEPSVNAVILNLSEKMKVKKVA
jgi:hypothetical protein